MHPTTRSAALFLARAGIFPTERHPVPSVHPEDNPVHRYPLAPPHPDPTLIGHTNGMPTPDRGQSDVWPHGEAGDLPA